MNKLYRSKKNRIIAGVCGGIGEYFKVDPTLVRLLWLLISVMGMGSGVVAYIIAWIIIPEEPWTPREKIKISPRKSKMLKHFKIYLTLVLSRVC